MAFVYILHSSKLDLFYIGHTAEQLDLRIHRHNSKYYDDKFTAKGIPWELFFSIECHSRDQAFKIEQHIKRMKSSTYINNLKKYPEMTIKLLLKYNHA